MSDCRLHEQITNSCRDFLCRFDDPFRIVTPAKETASTVPMLCVDWRARFMIESNTLTPPSILYLYTLPSSLQTSSIELFGWGRAKRGRGSLFLIFETPCNLCLQKTRFLERRPHFPSNHHVTLVKRKIMHGQALSDLESFVRFAQVIVEKTNLKANGGEKVRAEEKRSEGLDWRSTTWSRMVVYAYYQFICWFIYTLPSLPPYLHVYLFS